MKTKDLCAGGTSPEALFYRPFIELDCVLTRKLVHEGEFSDCPVIVGDVGVRSGFDRFWNIFEDQCMLIGFDADEDECAHLRQKYENNRNGRSPEMCIENSALWDREGKVDFHVNRDPNTSSCFLPNVDFFNRLPDPSPMDVLRTMEIRTTTIDRYHERKGIDFDVLKIDVQGGEYEILQGAAGQLTGSVLAVIAEVEFVELYRGQTLFSGIDSFMRKQGFALFDLDIRRWRRKPLSGTFDGIRVGQTIYADALYMWDPVEAVNSARSDKAKLSKLIKLAALAELFSLPDYAMEIVSLAGERRLINKKREKEMVTLLGSNRIVSRYDRNRKI